MRWFDLKRYGIEFAHNRDGNSDIVLKKDDPRRAFQLPQDVISAMVCKLIQDKKIKRKEL